jgi:hypothetical protein|tara:strand:- start:1833 stop:2051 length:219 start_codon:yes stop_codon:yes gene_type:complete
LSYQLRLHDLEATHEKLKNQVTDMQKHTHWNDYALQHLKKEKLRIKDQIYRLQKLDQGPEDTDYDRADINDY